MSKFVIGLVVGLSLCLTTAFKFGTDFGANCDVRIVTLDGHDYVIAVSSSSNRDGHGVAILHHVGCKRCNNNVSNER